MEFSRHEYWSGVPYPSPGDLPDPGIKSGSPALQADSLPSKPLGKPQFFKDVFKIKLYSVHLLFYNSSNTEKHFGYTAYHFPTYSTSLLTWDFSQTHLYEHCTQVLKPTELP